MSIFSNILKSTKKADRDSGRDLVTYGNEYWRGYYGWRLFGGRKTRPHNNYKDVIFFQFVKMIGVMFADVEWTYNGNEFGNRFEAFVKWFDGFAFVTWKELCYNGFVVVICERDGSNEFFRTLKRDEIDVSDNHLILKDKKLRQYPYFVMTSEVFDCYAMSDNAFLDSYLTLANKYLNNSDLAIDGNGHILFVSPTQENQHTATILDSEQKKEWEEDFKKNYGEFVDDWVNPYFSNRPCNAQDIDLTNFDTSNFEKLIKVMLIICGHFDLPANQIPLLEMSASKGLTTGTELIIGDTLKYKTFERILRYFAMIPEYFNLNVDYKILNNPNNNLNTNTTANEK